jgi:tRNA-2-methylthio-N6-dimethylallyladenosine synthase
MNVADSELVITILSTAGHTMVNDINEAELIMFNTCSVRAHAEDRVLGRISNERHRKKANPSLMIGVLGCMAQRIGKRLIDDHLGIDFAIGVDQYNLLPQILSSGIDKEHVKLDFDSEQVYPDLMPSHQSKTCGFVTIMRGCNNFCTYCIVPHVRGRERSRPWQDVYTDVLQAGKQGLKDITLLGQNVNSYNDEDLDFADLLRKVNEIEEIERIRFITSHPKDLSPKLMDTMAQCTKICEHIHLPLQSGNDRILNEMNRGYTSKHYMSLIERLKSTIPNIAITTDLIAGFPGETDEEFKDTLSIIRQVQFDYSFCFKYSPREGTTAASYTNQLPEDIRLARLQEMIDLQRVITLSKFRSQIGREIEVYVEDISKKDLNMVSGKTRDYKIAVLPGNSFDIGTLKTAIVREATAGTLIC